MLLCEDRPLGRPLGRLEEIILEMREITQTLILETVPGVSRRKPISEIPKAR